MRTISGGRHDRANWADKSLQALMVTRGPRERGRQRNFISDLFCRGGAGAGEPFFLFAEGVSEALLSAVYARAGRGVSELRESA